MIRERVYPCGITTEETYLKKKWNFKYGKECLKRESGSENLELNSEDETGKSI